MRPNPPSESPGKAASCLHLILKILAIAVGFAIMMVPVVVAIDAESAEPQYLPIEEYLKNEPDLKNLRVVGGYTYLPWGRIIRSPEADGSEARLLLFPVISKSLLETIQKSKGDIKSLSSEVKILLLSADPDLIYRVERLQGRSDSEIRDFLKASGDYWIFPIEIAGRRIDDSLKGATEAFAGQSPVSFDPATSIIDVRKKTRSYFMFGVYFAIFIAFSHQILSWTPKSKNDQRRSVRGIISDEALSDTDKPDSNPEDEGETEETGDSEEAATKA